jgi:hypothetical protein
MSAVKPCDFAGEFAGAIARRGSGRGLIHGAPGIFPNRR